MIEKTYIKSIELLKKGSSKNGFLASVNEIANYKRIWARDGVICGLSSLLDGDQKLIATFKETLVSLANNQHELGNIPSNVYFGENGVEVSFGGLAGRVDTVSWFVIGICNYVFFTNDTVFFEQMKPRIENSFRLLDAWEFNANHLMYIPRSGNWADEYITEAHIFYDQLLRLWALRCYRHLNPSKNIDEKIDTITQLLNANYCKTQAHKVKDVYHPRAYSALSKTKYWMASVTPSGYQQMYDAFANSLAILLGLNDDFNEEVVTYSEALRKSLPSQLLPAFWPPITPEDTEWNLLTDNCKYEFRNHPNEFHNGGTWQMVNGFYAASLAQKHPEKAKEVLACIRNLNALEEYGFYENFNSITLQPNGVPFCTWSAAGEVIATQFLKGKKLLV